MNLTRGASVAHGQLFLAWAVGAYTVGFHGPIDWACEKATLGLSMLALASALPQADISDRPQWVDTSR